MSEWSPNTGAKVVVSILAAMKSRSAGNLARKCLHVPVGGRADWGYWTLVTWRTVRFIDNMVTYTAHTRHISLLHHKYASISKQSYNIVPTSIAK